MALTFQNIDFWVDSSRKRLYQVINRVVGVGSVTFDWEDCERKTVLTSGVAYDIGVTDPLGYSDGRTYLGPGLEKYSERPTAATLYRFNFVNRSNLSTSFSVSAVSACSSIYLEPELM